MGGVVVFVRDFGVVLELFDLGVDFGDVGCW